MAYVKTIWETGDVITAAKLNNAEDGIAAHDPIIIETNAEWVTVGQKNTLTYDILAEDLAELYMKGHHIIIKVNAFDSWSIDDNYSQFDCVVMYEIDSVTYYEFFPCAYLTNRGLSFGKDDETGKFIAELIDAN